MRYEFIHDSIAKQVFFKAGAEARTRRKVEKYIREHFEAFRERGAELTSDDVEYIKPYLEVVNVGSEEAQFVKEGEAKLNRKRLRRRLLTASIIAFLSLATLVSLVLWQRSIADRRAADLATIEAERQEGIAVAKSDSLEIQGAALLVALDEARLAKDTAEIKRVEAELAKLFAQNQAAIARRARTVAERRAREAQSLALAATARSIEDGLPITALQLAQVAYGVIPEAPLPTVSQTLSALFYEQFADGDGGDPGAPLYAALFPYDPIQFEADRKDGRQRFAPVWSPDGAHYLLPTTGQRADLYRSDGSRMASLTHPADRIDAAAWAPDSRRLATGDQGGRILIWDLAGKELAQTRIPDWVSRLQFAPDGRYLYAWASPFTQTEGGRGGSIMTLGPAEPKLWVWEGQNREPTAVTTDFADYRRSDLLFSQDGRSLLLPDGEYDLTGRKVNELTRSGVGIQYAPTARVALVTDRQLGIQLWDLQEHRSLLRLDGTDNPVRDARLATQTGEVLVLYNDKNVELFSATGTAVIRLPPDDYAQVVVSPDGRYLVTKTGDRQVVWDREGKALAQLTETASIDIEPRFSPDGQVLLFRSDATHPAIWRPRRGVRVLADLHQADVRELQFDPTGRWILSRDEDNLAYLWTSDGRSVSRYDKHQGYIDAAVFAPDGDQLLTGDRVGRAYLWNVDQVMLVNQYGGQDPNINEIVPLPSTAGWLTRTRNGQYTLWNAETGSEQLLVTSRDAKYAIDPTGRYIAIQAGNRPVAIWDRSTGQQTATIDPQLAKLNDIRFSPDGRYLAAVTADGQLQLWTVDGKTTKAWPVETRATGAVRMAVPGNYVATTAGPVEFAPASSIRVRLPLLADFAPGGGYLVADARNSPQLFRLSTPRGTFPALRSIPLTPPPVVPTQGGAGASVRVWGTDGKLRQEIRYQGKVHPSAVSFSPDGALFAVELYKAGTVVYDSLGRLVSLNRALAGPQYVAFSSDNRHLVATYGRTFARIFDRSGTQRAELNQLNETVAAAAFSPDGQYILLRGVDRTAQLYDLQGQLVATFDRHGNRLEAAYFSEDGRYVVTLDRTGTLRRYPVPSEIYAWLQREGRLPPLTAAERSRYGLTDLKIAID